MDAFLYPELLYGSVAASSSLFKVSSNHFEAASNSNNKRFVNLNHKIKLNPVEAQKLNSELLKFNYGSKKEVVGGNCNTNRRNSNATEISISSQPEVCLEFFTVQTIPVTNFIFRIVQKRFFIVF
jgi:hypothetical protein